MTVKKIKDMSTEEVVNLTTLGLDDTFSFTCKSCGKCCKQRTDIILTPYDVFRLASDLRRTPKEIIERYCKVYIGETSHLPVVHIVSLPPDNRCPFLINKKCAVHKKKPVLCRVYPLARINYDDKTGYYFNGASCNHESENITVRKWLDDVASEEAEQAGRLWLRMVQALYPILLQEKPREEMEQLYAEIFNLVYLMYDYKQAFIPQFETNLNALQTFASD